MATRTLTALLLLGCAWGAVSESEDVVVNTTAGRLRGSRVTTGQDAYIDTFLGVPFGKPPVGPLRFSAPQPADAWTGIHNATQFSAMCPQLSIDGAPLGLPTSEDCLYLNVYSPKPASAMTPLPVMVWIYGGSYRSGTAAYYNGTELARKGVVVVTINYRLEALGFMSTLDDACPGNNGLLDQILALKWVKDNIASFHGDPQKVTVFGESAGSASVSLLKLSPLAKGLFQQAIMESGVSLSHWAVARPATDPVSPVHFAMALGKELGCVSQNNSALVLCLRNVAAADILNASKDVSGGEIVFRPTVETVVGVVPDDPKTLLMNGAGSSISCIRGVNKDEFSLFLLQTPLQVFTLANVKQQMRELAQSIDKDRVQEISDKLFKEYITAQNYTTAEQYRQALIQMNTDTWFIVPTIWEEGLNAGVPGHAAQYLYEFTYRATHTNRPAWAGVMHAEELPFVFGQPFSHDFFFAAQYPFNWTSQDETVSSNFLTLWTNFAKVGNPTPEKVGGVMWPAYTLDSQSYLDIGSSLTTGAKLREERVKFWNSLENPQEASNANRDRFGLNVYVSTCLSVGLFVLTVLMS